jgi:hypothetical protein
MGNTSVQSRVRSDLVALGSLTPEKPESQILASVSLLGIFLSFQKVIEYCVNANHNAGPYNSDIYWKYACGY